MGKGGGRRRKDKAREHFQKSENGKLKCKHCREEYAASTSVTRMEYHVSMNDKKGCGIERCSQYPQPNSNNNHLEHKLKNSQGI